MPIQPRTVNFPQGVPYRHLNIGKKTALPASSPLSWGVSVVRAVFVDRIDRLPYAVSALERHQAFPAHRILWISFAGRF